MGQEKIKDLLVLEALLFDLKLPWFRAEFLKLILIFNIFLKNSCPFY